MGEATRVAKYFSPVALVDDDAVEDELWRLHAQRSRYASDDVALSRVTSEAEPSDFWHTISEKDDRWVVLERELTNRSPEQQVEVASLPGRSVRPHD